MNRATNLSTDIREINFALYLDEIYGIDVTQGDTTLGVRKARARDLILRNGAADRVVAKGQTLGEAFHVVYGEPLVPDSVLTVDKLLAARKVMDSQPVPAGLMVYPELHESNDGQ